MRWHKTRMWTRFRALRLVLGFLLVCMNSFSSSKISSRFLTSLYYYVTIVLCYYILYSKKFFYEVFSIHLRLVFPYFLVSFTSIISECRKCLNSNIDVSWVGHWKITWQSLKCFRSTSEHLWWTLGYQHSIICLYAHLPDFCEISAIEKLCTSRRWIVYWNLLNLKWPECRKGKGQCWAGRLRSRTPGCWPQTKFWFEQTLHLKKTHFCLYRWKNNGFLDLNTLVFWVLHHFACFLSSFNSN